MLVAELGLTPQEHRDDAALGLCLHADLDPPVRDPVSR